MEGEGTKKNGVPFETPLFCSPTWFKIYCLSFSHLPIEGGTRACAEPDT